MTVVDMFTGFDRTTDLSVDGIHPSRAGYRKMASRWYTAIRPALALWRPTQRPTVVPAPTVVSAGPYARNAIPGTIQAENYDLDGEGVAYHDTTPTNDGGALRRDGVDITSVPGTGPVVGYMRAGEWLRYTVTVARGGLYTVSLRASSPSPSLISLRDYFHSFALLVSFGYPGFLSAGMVRTIFKIDRTASQIISRN